MTIKSSIKLSSNASTYDELTREQYLEKFAKPQFTKDSALKGLTKGEKD